MDTMMTSISDVTSTIEDLLTADIDKAKPLDKKQVAEFKDLFALEAEELGMFYNGFNLIFTIKAVYEEMSRFIKTREIKTTIDSNAYNVFLVVYPYFNDALIKQALGED